MARIPQVPHQIKWMAKTMINLPYTDLDVLDEIGIYNNLRGETSNVSMTLENAYIRETSMKAPCDAQVKYNAT